MRGGGGGTQQSYIYEEALLQVPAQVLSKFPFLTEKNTQFFDRKKYPFRIRYTLTNCTPFTYLRLA